MARPSSAVPADFAEIAPGKTNKQIAAHYGRGIVIISRWRKEGGVAAESGNEAKPMPADFATFAPTKTYAELSEELGVGTATLAKWFRAAGVKSRASSGGPRKPRAPKPPKATKPARRPLFGPPQALSAPADSTDAGQAATYLRRFYPNVYRASVLNKAERRAKGVPGDGSGHFFVGGRGLLPANDVIELARAKGWA